MSSRQQRVPQSLAEQLAEAQRAGSLPILPVVSSGVQAVAETVVQHRRIERPDSSRTDDATKIPSYEKSVLSHLLDQFKRVGSSHNTAATQLGKRVQCMLRDVHAAGCEPHPSRLRVWDELLAFSKRYTRHEIGNASDFVTDGLSPASTLHWMRVVGDIRFTETPPTTVEALPEHDAKASDRWRDALFSLLVAELNREPVVLKSLRLPSLGRDDIALSLSWADASRFSGHDISTWTSVQAICAALDPNRDRDAYFEVERCFSARRAELVACTVRRALGQTVRDLSILQLVDQDDSRWQLGDLTADDTLVDVKSSRYDSKHRQTWQVVKRFKTLLTADVLYDGVRSQKVRLHEYTETSPRGAVVYLGSTTRTRLSALARIAEGKVSVELWRAGTSGTSLPNWCFALPDTAYARHRDLAAAWYSLREALDAPLPALLPVTVAPPVTDPAPALRGEDIAEGVSWLNEADFGERGNLDHPESAPTSINEIALLTSFGYSAASAAGEPPDETVLGLARAVAGEGRWPAVLIVGLLKAFLNELQGGATFSMIQEAALFYPSLRMPLWVYDPTESVHGFYKTLRTVLVHADHVLRDIVSLRLVGAQQLHGLSESGECFTLVVNCGDCYKYPLIRGEAPACRHGDGKLECPTCGWCPHQPKSSRAW